MQARITLCVIFLLLAAVHCAVPQCDSSMAKQKNDPITKMATILNKAVLSFSVDMQEHGDEMRVQLYQDVERLFKLANSIPSDLADNELTLTKETIRQFATEFSNSNQHLGGTLLEYALNNTFYSKVSVSKRELSNDTQALFFGTAVRVGSFVANAIHNVGTYSTAIRNAATYIRSTVVPALNKHGFTKTAQLATTVSKAMTKTSAFTAKYEARLAKALAPIKNNQVFQGVRQTLNAIKAAMNAVRAAKAVYRGYKTAKSLAKAMSKNAVKGFRATRKTASKVAKSIKQGFKAMRAAVSKMAKSVKAASKTAAKKASRNVKSGLKAASKAAKRAAKSVKSGLKAAGKAAKRAAKSMKSGLNAARRAARNIAKSVKSAAKSNRGGRR